jgi:alkylation response protein AidB-like acyl-CoA dehydrogenase
MKAGIAAWCKEHMPEEKIKEWYAKRGIDQEVAKSWVDEGFGKLGIPEEYGGIPCDKLTLCIAIEELCHGGGNIPMAPNALINFDILEFGNPEQIKDAMDYYFTQGIPKYALAISEPDAGSDNQGMSTFAVKGDDGKYHINGTKTWVTNAEWSPGLIVVAKDDDPARENKSMSMWLVDSDTPGVRIENLNKIGMQIAPFSKVHFTDVVVDESARLGEAGRGLYNLMKNFEFERAVLIAELLGEAQAAMDDAAAWVNERKAFGVGINTFQLVQEHITDMQIKLTNSRNFLYRTCWKMDNGLPVNNDAAMLKRYAAPALTEVCSEALQLCGGLGFTDETRVSRLMLDCRGMQIGGGTIEIMVHIAGRGILKEYAKNGFYY